jgi:capsular polysaccharide biosynthesis protein
MRVAGSKKFLYLMLASMFAVALGFLSALFFENQDHRIYDRRQAEQALEIPVLGAISPVHSGP